MFKLIKLLLAVKIAFIEDKTLITYKALKIEISPSEVKLYSNGDLILDAAHYLLLCPEESHVKNDINIRCDLRQPARVNRK